MPDERKAGETTGRLWRRPRRRWLLGIPLGGLLMFLVGAGAVTAFNVGLEYTNTTEFCAGTCHEMVSFVVPDWQAGLHYSNRTGVRAGCPDCHVPKPFFAKIQRKTQATFKEGVAWLTGKIDTREKFDAHQVQMAEHVRAGMRANDSRECRNCHIPAHMDLDRQDRHAARRHRKAFEKGEETCIDCHEGIGHTAPDATAE